MTQSVRQADMAAFARLTQSGGRMVNLELTLPTPRAQKKLKKKSKRQPYILTFILSQQVGGFRNIPPHLNITKLRQSVKVSAKNVPRFRLHQPCVSHDGRRCLIAIGGLGFAVELSGLVLRAGLPARYVYVAFINYTIALHHFVYTCIVGCITTFLSHYWIKKLEENRLGHIVLG